MKLFFLVLGFLGCNAVSGQEKAVMVLNEVYCLGMRSCSPYVSIELELPPNTTRWFYTITTTKRPRKARRLKKHPAILAAFSVDSDIDKTDYEPELIPTGEGSCSVYLLKHRSDFNSFMEVGGVYFYYSEYSIKDVPSAVMLIAEPGLRHGTRYIGLQNSLAAHAPSNTYAVLTVVAMTH